MDLQAVQPIIENIWVLDLKISDLNNMSTMVKRIVQLEVPVVISGTLILVTIGY